MKTRFAVLTLASLVSAAHAGDAAAAKQLMTLMRADEVVAGAMKRGHHGARVREFASSPVGDKLLKNALIPNSNVGADKMAEVSAAAIENCGKAAK